MIVQKGTKKNQQTLCWKCDHACKGGCSWVDSFEPVPGWKAEHQVTASLDSYMVIDCPEFRPGGRLKNMDSDGANALIEKVLSECADDFIRCCDEIGEDVERFIRSKEAEVVYGIQDPDTIINALKKKRIQFRAERQKRQDREKRRMEESL